MVAPIVSLYGEASAVADGLDLLRYAVIGAVHEATAVNASTSDVLGFLESPLNGLAELCSRAHDLERRLQELGGIGRRARGGS